MAESIDMSEEVEMESGAEEKAQKRLVFPSLNGQAGSEEVADGISMSSIKEKMIAWVKRMREDPSFKVTVKVDENDAD